MTLRVYVYDRCSTCRKALAWLAAHDLTPLVYPIRTSPPSRQELTAMVHRYGDQPRAVCNTSGVEYRQRGLAAQLATMSLPAIVRTLHANGNLIKRPFLIGPHVGLVGFRLEEWERALA